MADEQLLKRIKTARRLFSFSWDAVMDLRFDVDDSFFDKLDELNDKIEEIKNELTKIHLYERDKLKNVK